MCLTVASGKGVSNSVPIVVCRSARFHYLRPRTPQDRKRGDKDKRSDKKDAKRLKRDEKEESVEADEESRQDENRRKKSKYVAAAML